MRKALLAPLLIAILSMTILPIVHAEDGVVCTECPSIQAIGSPSVPLSLKYNSYLKGGYVANGTAMRNYGYGRIDIMGVPAGSSVVKAILYWEILNFTESPDMRNGRFEGYPITGIPIASDIAEPCWIAGETGAWVYGIGVTSLIKPGINGAYSLSEFASGRTDGSGPWDTSMIQPLLEGASLVIIYKNPAFSDTLFQVYHGGVTFSTVIANTTLSGFSALSAAAKTTFVVGDGQGQSGDYASWNGVPIPSTVFNGRDVVDSTGVRNMTQGWLWDTQTYGVPVSVGDTSAVADIGTTSDCLTWVAQVFQVDSLPMVAPMDEIPEWTIFVGGTVFPSSLFWAVLPLIFGALFLAVALSRGDLLKRIHR